MRLLLAILAVLLTAPATAGAAPWVELPFTALDPELSALCLQSTGAGAAYVAEDAEEDETTELLSVGADGALAPDGSLRFGAFCPSVAVAPSGAAVAASADIDLKGGLVELAVREPGGRFGAPARVRQGRWLTDGIDAAIAPSGAAVVAWIEARFDRRRGEMRSRVRAVRRTPGGALGPPQTLSTRAEAFGTPLAGIDAQGRATVAWDGPARSGEAGWTATAAGGAAPFAPAERLGRGEEFVGDVALAVAAGGGVLVAYDTFDGIRVFERAAGAARFTAGPSYAGEFDFEKPVVALADDGGAAVAWQHDDDERDAVAPEIALRVPGGAFQAPRVLGTDALAAARPSFEVADSDDALQVAIGPGGAVTAAWLEAPPTVAGDHPSRVALVSGSLSGTWQESARFGSPARSAVGLTLLADPPAVLWADNLPDPSLDIDSEPAGSGRLHRAVPGAPAPPAAPLPELTLSARTQRLRAEDPLFVRARCSAACDLRAVTRTREPLFDVPAGYGATELTGPGTARLRILSPTGDTLVPEHEGDLTVIVTATAPGGTTPVIERLAVHARHAFVPPPRRPVDVRVVRRGGQLVVTWRTRRPARAERFVVSSVRDDTPIDTEFRSGGGRTRFRAVLDGAARARSIVLEWRSTEPRFDDGKLRVRLR